MLRSVVKRREEESGGGRGGGHSTAVCIPWPQEGPARRSERLLPRQGQSRAARVAMASRSAHGPPQGSAPICTGTGVSRAQHEGDFAVKTESRCAAPRCPQRVTCLRGAVSLRVPATLRRRLMGRLTREVERTLPSNLRVIVARIPAPPSRSLAHLWLVRTCRDTYERASNLCQDVWRNSGDHRARLFGEAGVARSIGSHGATDELAEARVSGTAQGPRIKWRRYIGKVGTQLGDVGQGILVTARKGCEWKGRGGEGGGEVVELRLEVPCKATGNQRGEANAQRERHDPPT